jgi:hypothetical protein
VKVAQVRLIVEELKGGPDLTLVLTGDEAVLAVGMLANSIAQIDAMLVPLLDEYGDDLDELEQMLGMLRETVIRTDRLIAKFPDSPAKVPYHKVSTDVGDKLTAMLATYLMVRRAKAARQN